MTTEEKKSGLSRRDLIKKGAVAGAVVWTVPMIESVPAYAATGSGGAIPCSWAYIIWMYQGGNALYLSGFQNTGGQNVCNSFANTSAKPSGNNGHNATTGPTLICGTTTYTMLDNQQGTSAITVVGTLSADLPLTVDPTAPSCTAITQSGNTIQAASNVVILASYFYGGATGFVGTCGSGTAGATINLPASC